MNRYNAGLTKVSLVLLVVFLLASSRAVFAFKASGEGTMTVKGFSTLDVKVVDQNNSPLANTVLTVFNETGHQAGTGITNSSGLFALNRIVEGVYVVVATIPTSKISATHTLRISAGTTIQDTLILAISKSQTTQVTSTRQTSSITLDTNGTSFSVGQYVKLSGKVSAHEQTRVELSYTSPTGILSVLELLTNSSGYFQEILPLYIQGVWSFSADWFGNDKYQNAHESAIITVSQALITLQEQLQLFFKANVVPFAMGFVLGNIGVLEGLQESQGLPYQVGWALSYIVPAVVGILTGQPELAIIPLLRDVPAQAAILTKDILEGNWAAVAVDAAVLVLMVLAPKIVESVIAYIGPRIAELIVQVAPRSPQLAGSLLKFLSFGNENVITDFLSDLVKNPTISTVSEDATLELFDATSDGAATFLSKNNLEFQAIEKLVANKVSLGSLRESLSSITPTESSRVVVSLNRLSDTGLQHLLAFSNEPSVFINVLKELLDFSAVGSSSSPELAGRTFTLNAGEINHIFETSNNRLGHVGDVLDNFKLGNNVPQALSDVARVIQNVVPQDISQGNEPTYRDLVLAIDSSAPKPNLLVVIDLSDNTIVSFYPVK